MQKRTALLIGATGMVGEQCLRVLVKNPVYERIIVLSRRELEWTHPKIQFIQADFDQLDKYLTGLSYEDVFCALGTTIGKAGSQEAFRKIDLDYPMTTATLSLKNGAKRFVLVSALGANKHSTIFYNRVKGELEESLQSLGYETLIILRPSILLGERKEQRRGEEVARFVSEKFSFLFAGPMKKYRGAPADMIARVMVKLATANIKGCRIIENQEIFELDPQ